MPQAHRNFLCIAAIALLLCAYAALSYSATRTKNPVVDEPTHAMQAYMARWYGDYRVEASNPPLWLRWVALGQPKSILPVNFSSPIWPSLLNDFWDSWKWYLPILYDTPGNNPDRFFDHSRRMMVILAVALGALIAWWSWKLAGPLAATVAVFCFAFDPNFLAHGSLVKNDVAIALCLTGLSAAIWKWGQRSQPARAPSPWWSLAVVFCCGAAIATKFSGLIGGAILIVLVCIWIALQKNQRRKAFVTGATLCLAAAIGSYAIVWASYGFQFGMTRDPSQRMDLEQLERYATRVKLTAQNNGRPPSDAQVDAEPASPLVRSAMCLDRHRLLPEPFIAGFIYLNAFNHARTGYLLGEQRMTGWWYYFPLAGLFKTPIASLIAAALAVWVLLWTLIRKKQIESARSIDLWSASCLIVPLVVFGLAAMSSGQDVGIRHIFPMAPPIFILIGIAASRARQRWGKIALAVELLLAVGLVTESLASYPNYLTFFNAAVGGSRGGLALLSDSNLDWGQDMKGLGNWRKAHPDGQLIIECMGMTDPTYYLGPDYRPLQTAMAQGTDWARQPGYLAVSATHLQGVYVPPGIAKFYARLRTVPPVAIIGGSIYIYRLPVLDTRPISGQGPHPLD